MAIQISDILSRVSEPLPGLQRKSNPNTWEIGTMLKAVEEIGKKIDPRFVLDDDNRWTYAQLIMWVMNDVRIRNIVQTGKNEKTEIAGRPDKGIYLGGPTGTGKTVAMNIVRELYKINRFTYKEYLKNGMAVDRVAYWQEFRADQITDDFAQNGDLTLYKTTPLLCIQDLGSEPTETLYMGNRANVLRQIIEYRGDLGNKAVTLITSNFSPRNPAMRERYGDRAISRLIEMTNYLPLEGRDRRYDI